MNFEHNECGTQPAVQKSADTFTTGHSGVAAL